MENRAVLNLMLTAFGIAFCVVLFSLSAAGSDMDAATADEVEELDMREDRAVTEVNDEALAEIERIKAARRTRYIDEELGYVPDVNLVSSDELATIEARRAEREMSLRARYGYDINSIQVTGQMSEVKWKEQSQLAVVFKPVVLGTVTGIVLYNNQGAALVAGEIAREDDTVLGNKVVRITPDYVEFGKGGKTWKQMVGQPPPPAVWVEPEKPSSNTKPKTSK